MRTELGIPSLHGLFKTIEYFVKVTNVVERD